MDEVEELVAELATIPGIEEVAAADETGTYVAGYKNDKPEEFAAILAFVSRSGNTLGDLMGTDSLESVRVSGKKHRLFVASVGEYTVGVRVALDAVAGLTHRKIKSAITKFEYALEEV